MTKCDVCGDESNSASNLPCGRDFGEELEIEEGKVICPGTYRAPYRHTWKVSWEHDAEAEGTAVLTRLRCVLEAAGFKNVDAEPIVEAS